MRFCETALEYSETQLCRVNDPAYQFEVDRAVELRLEGRSQTEIAETLGREQSWVSRLFSRLRKAGRPELTSDLRRNPHGQVRFRSTLGDTANI